MITVRPLTPERWPDLEALFNARGCSIAKQCWCMAYRRSGTSPPPPKGVTRRERNRRELRALADADPPAGLIGYRGKAPVGWISLGPREDFKRLENSPLMRPVDGEKVWSIVCFNIRVGYRRRGVAAALLDGVVDYVR